MKGFYFFLIFSFLFYSKTSNLKLNVKEKGKGLMGFIMKRKKIISLSFLAFHTINSLLASLLYQELKKNEFKYFPILKHFLYGFIPFYYSIEKINSVSQFSNNIKNMSFILPFYFKVYFIYPKHFMKKI